MGVRKTVNQVSIPYLDEGGVGAVADDGAVLRDDAAGGVVCPGLRSKQAAD